MDKLAKEYLNMMMSDIKKNSITLEDFMTYYENLILYIENDFIDKPVMYIMALRNALILPIKTREEEYLYQGIKEDLEKSLKIYLKDYLESIIDFEDYFISLLKIEDEYILADKYIEIYKMFDLARIIEPDNVDLFRWAEHIFQMNVSNNDKTKTKELYEIRYNLMLYMIDYEENKRR